MKYEKYLPIGTVVLLKEGKKRVMITGFCTIPKEDSSKIFDYNGCLYPEGILSSEQSLLFNHDQIVKIFHLGLSDDEEKEFKKKLNAFIQENKNSTIPSTTTSVQENNDIDTLEI